MQGVRKEATTMSIYDSGYQFPWEIWTGLILAAIILYLGIRSSRRADRKHAAQHAPRPTGTAPKTTPGSKRPTPPKD
jgi:NhaP-type Na+/H+ or K+/H+ antiporter